VQDVAGDDHVPPALAPLLESDGFGARQRVQAVERLVQYHDLRIVRRGLRQLHALPHAFAVGCYLAVPGVKEPDSLKRRHGALVAFRVGIAEHAQIRIDELVAGEALGKRVELGAITYQSAEFFGMAWARCRARGFRPGWGGSARS
jgi:hypothetical protein